MIEDPLLEKNFPTYYRKDVVKPIFENILKGDSFSFIGIEDNCKSNVMRFICYRNDVQKMYLKKVWDKYIFLYVDLNELMTPSVISFYQLLGLSLIETLKRLKLDFSFLNNIFDDRSERLLKSLKEDFLALIEKTEKNIVIVFNEFDICAEKFDLETLSRNLIALRNSARYKVSYIFIGLKPFSPQHYFYQKIIYMTPFFGRDAIDVVKRNSLRYQIPLGKSEVSEIIRLSGGHAGTIKFIVQTLSRNRDSDANKQLKNIYKNSDINLQCERIIWPLTYVERAKLQSNQSDELLQNLCLQVIKNKNARIFSPILEHHLKVKKYNSKPFSFDKENNEIYFFGDPIMRFLSVKEGLLLSFLIENENKVLTREEIMAKVWDGVEYPSDWSFDKLTSRLRRKLNYPRTNYIKTLKGIGLILDQ